MSIRVDKHGVSFSSGVNAFMLCMPLLIGVIAAISYPQYKKIQERIKFEPIPKWIAKLETAENEYYAKHSKPSSSFKKLGLEPIPPPFALDSLSIVGTGTIRWADGSKHANWVAQIIRLSGKEGCPVIYGCYTTTYTYPPGRYEFSKPKFADDLLP